MNISELLSSPNSHERLKGARRLALHASGADIVLIKQALMRETVVWVRAALQEALERASGIGESEKKEAPPTLIEPDHEQEVYAQAVSSVSRGLVHEINPMVGASLLYANQLLDQPEKAQIISQLNRMVEYLAVVEKLARVSAVPNIIDFDLAEQISAIVHAIVPNRHGVVQLAGSRPLIVAGDPALVDCVIRNGIKNAVESVASMMLDQDGQAPVVVNWGATRKDYWVVVLDRGMGLQGSTERLFQIGATNKQGHFGMGLSLAQQAAASLNGTITLTNRTQGGAQFEFRWRKPIVDYDQNLTN